MSLIYWKRIKEINKYITLIFHRDGRVQCIIDTNISKEDIKSIIKECNRKIDEIKLEVKSMSDRGAREIILLGQNVNAYQSNYHNVKYSLANLINTVSEIEDVKRIRYTTAKIYKRTARISTLTKNIKRLIKTLNNIYVK